MGHLRAARRRPEADEDKEEQAQTQEGRATAIRRRGNRAGRVGRARRPDTPQHHDGRQQRQQPLQPQPQQQQQQQQRLRRQRPSPPDGHLRPLTAACGVTAPRVTLPAVTVQAVTAIGRARPITILPSPAPAPGYRCLKGPPNFPFLPQLPLLCAGVEEFGGAGGAGEGGRDGEGGLAEGRILGGHALEVVGCPAIVNNAGAGFLHKGGS